MEACLWLVARALCTEDAQEGTAQPQRHQVILQPHTKNLKVDQCREIACGCAEVSRLNQV